MCSLFRRREVEAALAARGIRPSDVASFAVSAQRSAAEQAEADAEKVRVLALQAIAMDVKGRAVSPPSSPQHSPAEERSWLRDTPPSSERQLPPLSGGSASTSGSSSAASTFNTNHSNRAS